MKDSNLLDCFAKLDVGAQDIDNEFCNAAASESLKKLGRRVKAIKSSEEVSMRYMQEWEERELERREALEEGKL